MLKIKFKKLHPQSQAPVRSSEGAAGFDLSAVSIDYSDRSLDYHTGIAVEIPPGYVGLCFMRSSVVRTKLSLANAVGVIDSDYRGEIVFKFRATSSLGPIYQVGDRIGQIVIVPAPAVEFEEGELSETVRGNGGFGSTGK